MTEVFTGCLHLSRTRVAADWMHGGRAASRNEHGVLLDGLTPEGRSQRSPTKLTGKLNVITPSSFAFWRRFSGSGKGLNAGHAPGVGESLRASAIAASSRRLTG